MLCTENMGNGQTCSPVRVCDMISRAVTLYYFTSNASSSFLHCILDQTKNLCFHSESQNVKSFSMNFLYADHTI